LDLSFAICGSLCFKQLVQNVVNFVGFWQKDKRTTEKYMLLSGNKFVSFSHVF